MLSHRFLSFSVLVAVQAKAGISRTSKSFPSQVIFQTPDSFFFENIAVGASSELLLTSAVSPTLFSLDPTTVDATLNPVHTFPNANALTGIIEYRPNMFVVIASIINVTTRQWTPGSIVVWSVDFTATTPKVHVLGGLTDAEAANGITALPGQPDTLLISDSIAGAVWQINTHLCSPALPALGINGLHVRDAYLYFTNSQQQLFGRVPLAVKGGNVTAARAVEKLGTVEDGGPDDFAFDIQGRAWVTVHPGALALFSPPASGRGNWTQLTAVGNADGTDPGLIQPTGAAFGCGSPYQETILYVTTDVGQVVAVDTSA
ncbi:hypothetical protein B0H14DRAFT_2639865 [Mycena olivaceomarginata]|nr:hypothetical protein B0H14DRAFT_2639865 [Mycena olivaceomarginata]